MGHLWAIVVLALVGLNLAHPMLYKRTENDKYEPDLIPVSSTVIPLSVYEVSYGIGDKLSEEDKIAYLKKLRKKVKHEVDFEEPDILITSKTKHHDRDKGKIVKVELS